MVNTIINGDCLEVMQSIPDKSIDMILCDLPYGTTACKWDTIIPFEPLWKQYKRVIKNNGAIALTASQPFTSVLVMSNIKMFKYEWVWDKIRPTGFLDAKRKPLKQHENILIFGIGTPKYNPQGLIKGKFDNSRPHKENPDYMNGRVYGKIKNPKVSEYTNYPKTIYRNDKAPNNLENIHPTQKPVALFEYLIKTYTNENETVLDNCSGSGTTAIACINTNRNYICIEKDKTYYDLSTDRVNNHKQNLFNKAC